LFSDTNVSQGVATYATSGGVFSNQFTANLSRNLPDKNSVNRLKFDRIMATSLWPRFLAHPVCEEIGMSGDAHMHSTQGLRNSEILKHVHVLAYRKIFILLIKT